MADLGAIGDWVGATYIFPAHTISGTVRDDTGAGVRRQIRVYLRSTGALVAEGFSRADGTYEIPVSFPLEGQPHMVVFLDDDAGTQYNALVLDRLTP